MRDLIRKILREELNKYIDGFIVGKCYKYNELSSKTKSDINIQFKIFSLEDDEDPNMDYPHYQQPLFDGDPKNYLYCFKYLTEKEALEKYPELYLLSMSNPEYMESLITNIRKNGLKNPPVGYEGNHRVMAFIKMGKPIPYLEIIRKNR
jgi:hypothetical protein